MTKIEQVTGGGLTIGVTAKASMLSMFGGASLSGAGWLTTTELAAVIGAIVAVLGFAVNCITLIIKNKRAREHHEAEMTLLAIKIDEAAAERDMLKSKAMSKEMDDENS